MSFKPFEKSVKTLFSGDNRYKIPNFQRDFSWETSNFDDFFDDLFHFYEEKSLKPEDDKGNYFFGTILLIGNESYPDVNAPYEVIDGQQRLTTMTLFFAAICNIINKFDDSYELEFPDRLYFNSIKSGKSSKIERLVNNALNPILPVEILNLDNLKSDGASVTPISSEQTWLLEAYQYIHNLLGRENVSRNDISDSEYVEILENLGNVLSNSTMICIYHNNKDEANALFRNLNFRGKPLSQYDLIKNEVYNVVSDRVDYVSSIWSEIERNIFDAKSTMQDLIYHYMKAKYKNISNTNLFDKFLKNVEPDRKQYIDYLNNLKTNSKYYKIMLLPDSENEIFGTENYFNRDDNNGIKRNLIFFKEIEIKQLRILLLALFECRDKGYITNKVFKNYIELVARHQCIHVLVKSPANKLTTIYDKFSKKLYSLEKIDKAERNKKANEYLRKFKEELISKLPEKNSLLDTNVIYKGNSVSTMKGKERKDFSLIKYILQSLSYDSQDKESNKGNDGLEFIFNSTIEHIIDKENISEDIYDIGNLILLEKDLHKNVKTRDEKIEMYSNSKITMTRKFWKQYSSFEEEDIPKRSKEILENFYDMIVK